MSGALHLGAKHGLHLCAVDDTCKVGIVHGSTGEVVTLLQGSTALQSSIDGGQLLEGTLSEDHKASESTTWGQAKQVQSINVCCFHSCNVAHGASDAVVLIVDDQRTQALHIAAIAGFALACPQSLGSNDLLQLLTTSQLLQCLHCLLGLGQRLDAISHHQGELSHLIDSVATCHHQWWQAAGSQSHCNGMALLGHIHTAVPAAPDLGRVEHASTPGLVSKCRLSGTVSATTGSTRNTCHSTTSAPRFSRRVVARLWAHCIGLPLVLCHVGVDLTDKVWSQW
mmetsp:Transcript_1424/g.1416  ORF Transcript_1424/g.1416 Transcript_1424/m.1416 type:complete len:282 (+) Transcript_1424:293-1138(+)